MSGSPAVQRGDGIPTERDARALAERVMGHVTADEAAVQLVAREHGHTRFAANQVTTSGNATEVAATLTVRSGQRSASVTFNGLDDAGAAAAARRAEAMVAVVPEDPEAVPLLEPQTYATPAAYAEETAGLDDRARADAVSAMIAVAAGAGMQGAGFLERVVRAEAVANSAGLFAYHRSTQASLATTVRTADGTGSGWAGTTHNRWGRMVPPAELARQAVDVAGRSRQATAIEPGSYPVVLAPTAVGNLLQLVYRSLDARAAAEGRSAFSAGMEGDRIGEQVVDARVTLLSDPEDPDLLERPFAADGLPLGPTTWIQDGVLRTLAADRHWASVRGIAPTAQGGGLRMAGAEGTAAEVATGMERGIYVTRFWYIREVNPRTLLYTGLTRDGTFLIENGRLTRPLKNLRFTQSLLAMLNAVVALGAPVRVVASESGGLGEAVVVPPVAVSDFRFTAVSDAV